MIAARLKQRRIVSGPTPFEALVLLTVAVLAAHQLLVAPIVGMADNGDYVRIMQPVGLAHIGTSYEDTVFLWVQPRYRIVPVDTALFLPSAELLLAGLARGIDALFGQDDRFDLRVLGAVHLAFFLAAIWLVLRGARSLPMAALVVVCVGVILVTPDVAYVAYLNSFYSEPAGVIFMLAVVGTALPLVRGTKPSRVKILAYFVAVALFSSTKVQNYALAIPLAVLPVGLVRSETWREVRRLTGLLVCSLAVLVVVFFSRLPEWQTAPAHWNSLFHGILMDSPSPEQDLAEFGLEPELVRWTGVHAAGGLEVDGEWRPAPVTSVARRYDLRDIAWFYLSHPDRLIKTAALCAKQAFVWRYAGIGNYTRESGKPPASHAPSYTGWSDLEETLLPRNLWFLVSFFALFVGIAGWELRQGLDRAAGRTAFLCLTLALTTMTAFGVVVGAGGIEDVVDLFMFRVLFDICLVSGVAWMSVRLEPLLPSGDLLAASRPAAPRLPE